MIARRNTLRVNPERDDRHNVLDLFDKVSSMDSRSLADVSIWQFIQYKYYHSKMMLLMYLYEHRYNRSPFI